MPVLTQYYNICVSRAHHAADRKQLSVCVHFQRTSGLSDQLTARADLSLNDRNYPQSALTFCGCLFSAVLCVNWLLSSQGRKKKVKSTRDFKVNTAVNIKFTLLRFLTHYNFVLRSQYFGGNLRLRLQDIMQKVAVFPLTQHKYLHYS